MFNVRPILLIVVGVLMMLVGGVIIPLLMVIHLMEPTFLLTFGSYAVSVAGLYMGVIGVARYVQKERKR
jgi:hypothetical protein